MTPESDALLRKSRRSLEAGRLLLSKGFLEDVASGAYYAMLYAAKAMLLNSGQKATQHKHVTRKFQELFIATGKVEPKFYESLEGSLKRRHFADYETDLTFAISNEEAEASLKEAAAFLAMAEQFLGEENP